MHKPVRCNPLKDRRPRFFLEQAGKFGVPVLLDSNGWDIKEEFNFLQMVFKHPATHVILAHAFLQRSRDLAIPIMLSQGRRDCGP